MTIDLSDHVPLLAFLLSYALFAAVIFFWLRLQKRKNRRPPFTQDFLRSPGESLRQAVQEELINIMSYTTALVSIPSFFLASYSWEIIRKGKSHEILYAVIVLLSTVYLLYKIIKSLNRLKTFRLGMEGERAVGEELNQLMLQGYHVFHDIPKENGGNIDHVVVGKNGVFAIETKARSKNYLKGKKYVVTYKNNKLTFNHRYTTTAPLQQAKNHARWLHNFLKKETGESVFITPVVIIPGWYIKLKDPPNDVFILATGQIQEAFKTLPGRTLNTKEIQTISNKLDQVCRTVRPWTPDKK